jgi:hypothetical protein
MCVKTLSAWKIGKKSNGKDNITFTAPRSGKGEYVMLPCGQCIECRLERSRQWAVRCMHEASLHEENCFITLTFNDENLDPYYSLRKRDFQLFMKRLRKHLSASVSPSDKSCVRYFHCGEYGEEFERPHHHAILFGFDFPDKVLKVVRDGNHYYESPLLDKLWSDPVTGESYGFHEITSVTFETCAYVARYCVKKVNGEKADEHYTYLDEQGNFHKRVPEYSTMSRRPGIGLGWFNEFKDTDVYAWDEIIVRGHKKCKPPRYYDRKYEESNPFEYSKIKEKRIDKIKNNPENRFERQRVREVVKVAQSKMLKRSII